MRNRVCVTSVRLSVTSIAVATAAGEFAAERRADRRYRSTAAGAVMQTANAASVTLRADGGGSTET